MRIAVARILASVLRISMRTGLHSFHSADLLASIAMLLLSPGYAAMARRSPEAVEPAFQVKDIATQADSTASASPSQLVQIGNVVYFAAYSESTGRELWKSDGTPAGTAMVKTLPTSARLTNADGALFFISDDSLWFSDGTSGGTLPVKQLSFNDTCNPSRQLTSLYKLDQPIPVPINSHARGSISFSQPKMAALAASCGPCHSTPF
ncbi:MAG TPA: hypothetical protein VKE41_20180 [Roseiflexaceae bacterium]|nr:hypothetical protein [Roseiflexaceae bacterium]